jgi:anti-sigma regulatory factor (Ser/Thr protein kinase)
VKELFHNINDHSSIATGFIHVQHYPNARVVKITVSDFGIGIPDKIRSFFGPPAAGGPPLTDGAAILMASRRKADPPIWEPG